MHGQNAGGHNASGHNAGGQNSGKNCMLGQNADQFGKRASKVVHWAQINANPLVIFLTTLLTCRSKKKEVAEKERQS